MGALPESRIADLLLPYFSGSVDAVRLYPSLAPKFATYLDVLLRWNARTNLTSIRDPEEIVRRHFGEGVFVALNLKSYLPAGAELLDFGSGAGFPGLPIQICLPELRCTLAESQGKKASFLREAVRVLGVTADIWADRVESMPPERMFRCVTMRAVDAMEKAVPLAEGRVEKAGILAILAGDEPRLSRVSSFHLSAKFSVPESERRMLYLYARG